MTHENPFKDHRPSHHSTMNVSQKNSNFDGGPLYGVSERDNWLLAKDEAVDEVHIS